jgi:hypothetical protein
MERRRREQQALSGRKRSLTCPTGDATCSRCRSELTPTKAAALPAIEFAYRPAPLKIVNNGHTVQVTYASGSFLTVGDRKYELQQFHFHHPAEEKVNGKSYPLVTHLVHLPHHAAVFRGRHLVRPQGHGAHLQGRGRHLCQDVPAQRAAGAAAQRSARADVEMTAPRWRA